ncbi:MAG: paraquat-inducible protein A, partial [Rhodobacterales bacterium 17-64-5]
TIEVAWGLYLFTGCILASIFIAWRSKPAASEDSRKA